MKTVKLTYDETVELLDRAVKEKGAGHIYHSETGGGLCSYFHGNEPGCIVGHVLSYKGIGAMGVRDIGFESADGQGLAHITGNQIKPADDKVDLLLEVAQQSQDSGTPWGEAVAKAKATSAEEAA